MRPDNPLTGAYLDRYPGEAAQTLEGLPETMAAGFLTAVEPARAGAVLSAMVAPAAAAVLAVMPVEQGAAVVQGLDGVNGERLLRLLPPARLESLLAAADGRARRRLSRHLRYPVDVAGTVMETTPFLLPVDIDAAEAMRRVRGATDAGCDLFVVDRDHRLVGAFPLGQLLRSPGSKPLRELMRRDVQSVEPHAPLTRVAAHPAWERLRALPVVDAGGVVVGIVRFGDVAEALRAPEQGMAPALSDQGLAAAQLAWLGMAEALTALFGAGTERGSD